ncbi:MAG: ATPase [Lentisphaerae bacterium]|jgi:predicted Fe-Mo cluster-binding NifX family protein|nr:ATPase [Lentisphaerota bacterium]
MVNTKIAIPIANGALCMHFGHCQQFAIVEVDIKNKEIVSREDKTPPPHEPGVLPAWLSKEGVKIVLAGGMGNRAQNLFSAQGIEVMVGLPAQTPEELVTSYLNGTLKAGQNVCDH